MSENESITLSVKKLSKVFRKSNSEEIKALDEVSFDLLKGEILGVIGKNGSGKSTLLKILSQITGPTDGEIVYDGVLTSIIEIGTGFHHDLTGRENVYLGGVLLGVSKAEMDQLYASIVSFSGLDEFMDMPVKQYSSGMYLRLAFSVAFHSPIDILILDEVLAVGDFDFRRKCYDKIRFLSGKGVSIILVSHNLEPVLEFCDRCILMNSGRIRSIGTPMDVVEEYIGLVNQNPGIAVSAVLKDVETPTSKLDINELNRPDAVNLLKHIEIKAVGKAVGAPIMLNDAIQIQLDCLNQMEKGHQEITIYINNINGVRVLMDSPALRPTYAYEEVPRGLYRVSCVIPRSLLNRGIYSVGLILTRNKVLDQEIAHAGSFAIQVDPDKLWQQRISAIIRPELDWNIQHIKD